MIVVYVFLSVFLLVKWVGYFEDRLSYKFEVLFRNFEINIYVFLFVGNGNYFRIIEEFDGGESLLLVMDY